MKTKAVLRLKCLANTGMQSFTVILEHMIKQKHEVKEVSYEEEGVRKLILTATFSCACCVLSEALHNRGVILFFWQKQKLVQTGTGYFQVRMAGPVPQGRRRPGFF